MRKKKLSLNEQIEYMKNTSGIKFNIVDEEAAKDFLKNNSYYFKIKSYAKNYEKYAQGNKVGKYVNLGTQHVRTWFLNIKMTSQSGI